MIEVNNLTKRYTNGKGVFEVNFSVEKGEVFGFLGPNGAGKTTTIRNLLGFTNPTEGNCIINGMDCRKKADEIHKMLGYIPGETAFFNNMTGMQFLKFMADMRSYKDNKIKDRLIEKFELESDRKIRKMSKGMKQKLGLIAAFMHDPEILILDEPTSGLDPLMQKKFVELINEEKNKGKTILMSSHIFDEVEKTCQRAAIIREGRIAAIENISTFKSSLRKSYHITVGSDRDIEIISKSGLEHIVYGSNKVEIFIGDDYSGFLKTLSQCKVTSLESSSQTLEQIFIKYYGKEV